MAKDPIGFGGGGANLFAYVHNDPVNLVDPTGKLALLPIFGGVFGGAMQAWTNYDAYKCGRISGGEYAIAIGLGVLTGALSALPGGIVSGALAGGAAATVNTMFNGEIRGKPLRLRHVGRTFAAGAIAGAIASGAAKLGSGVVQGNQTIPMAIPAPPLGTYGQVGGIVGNVVGTYVGTVVDE